MTKPAGQAQLSISNISDVSASIEAFCSGKTDYYEFEDIIFELPVEPVSLRASRSRKDTITSLIQSMTRNASFVLTGDVHIEIEWFLHPQKRYESDVPPDVDNIIKPLLDALCGPDGIMVDDCQVQHISCNWLDWDRDDQQIRIHVHFFSLDWCLKEKLLFVHLGKGICFPFSKVAPPDRLLESLEFIEKVFERYHQVRNLTETYWEGIGSVPGQRVFHISRLSKFPVVDLKSLKSKLKCQLQDDA